MSYSPGDHKQDCDRCGFTFLASQLKYEKQTDSMVCSRCWDEDIVSMADMVGKGETGQIDGAKKEDTPIFLDTDVDTTITDQVGKAEIFVEETALDNGEDEL